MSEAFDNRAERDSVPGCTCGTAGLELGFSVSAPLDFDPSFDVIDAECMTICTTSNRAFAELIVWALNRADNGRSEVCRIHTVEWWAERAKQFAIDRRGR
jgi:hypothetical protein